MKRNINNADSKYTVERLKSMENQDIEILRLRKENYELQIEIKKYDPMRNEIVSRQNKVNELLKQRESLLGEINDYTNHYMQIKAPHQISISTIQQTIRPISFQNSKLTENIQKLKNRLNHQQTIILSLQKCTKESNDMSIKLIQKLSSLEEVYTNLSKTNKRINSNKYNKVMGDLSYANKSCASHYNMYGELIIKYNEISKKCKYQQESNRKLYEHLLNLQ